MCCIIGGKRYFAPLLMPYELLRYEAAPGNLLQTFEIRIYYANRHFMFAGPVQKPYHASMNGLTFDLASFH